MDPTPEPRRLIDLRPALGEAGHEVHDMGWDGVPDSAPLRHETPENDHDADDALDVGLSFGALD